MGLKNRKSYTAWHPIFDGAAVLYRTPASGDVWQFRTWIAAEKKEYRKTMATSDLESAIERGKKRYVELQHSVLSGKKLFGLTARQLVDQFLTYQQERVNTGLITQGRFSTIKTQLNRHFLGFLGKGNSSKGEKVKTGELERGMFYDFAQYRRKKNPDVQEVTIRNEQTTLNALFKWAKRQELVSFDRVDFEEIKIRDIGRRDTFEMKEYRQLRMALWTNKWIKDGLSPKEREQRQFIRHFILIMAHTFMRFGEQRFLKWSDVLEFKKYKDEKHKDLLVRIRVRREIAKNRQERAPFFQAAIISGGSNPIASTPRTTTMCFVIMTPESQSVRKCIIRYGKRRWRLLDLKMIRANFLIIHSGILNHKLSLRWCEYT